jgi:hypothetical protein
MALTKATLIDLNANELILDLDADTSITADTDDTIHFKIAGSDEITITAAGLSPASADGNALGTAALEWSDLYLADGAVISLGADQDVTLTHVADTGILLNSTMAIQFNDASQYINAPSATVLDINATDEIELNATLVDVNANLDVSGTIVAAGALTAATSITVGSAALTEAELELLDGLTAGTAIASKVVTTDASIDTTGQRNLTITGVMTGATLEATGDTSASDNAAIGYTAAEGLILTGQGSTNDVTVKNDADATVISIPTGTTGVTFAGTIGSGAITSTGVVTGTGFTIGSAVINEAELETIDGITAGTVIASKALVADANIDITGGRNITISGELDAATGDFSGAVDVAGAFSLAGTAITTTAAEINLIDGGTARGTDAVASGDGILINDGGTMKMTNVDTVSTYFSSHNVGGAAIVTTGALDSGSITSGFGAIDNGTSGIRSDTITAETAFVPDANDGADIGTTSLGFNDLFLADGGIIKLGNDQDVTLTHVADTGILLNSTMAIQFNDASQYINAPSNAILDINATDEIELNATLVDVNANVEISGTASVGGVLTTSSAISGSTAEFSGAVTIQGAVIINEDSADVDTRIESNGNTHMIFVDGGSDHVNIGTSSDLGGTLNVNGIIYGPSDVGLNAGDKISWTNDTDTRFHVNGNEEMRLEADGDLHVDGDVIAYSTTISDATLKYNINPIEFALDKVKQLKGVTFNYFKDNKESAGLLAQDVEKVMPSAVSERKLPLHTGDEKAYKTLHYDSIHALLIESIKELTTKLEESTKRIETLENR